jgi:asparagine synthase (glutamine-hydrolysing)
VSVQFGIWNFDGKLVDPDYLDKVSPLIAPYGPDGAGSHSKGNVSILYRAFHTTKESRRESQPHVTSSGAFITWDGRLDNRAELIGRLGDLVTAHSTDVEIVSAAYEYWWEDCFAMLIGDWALSIWNPHTRSLILAKDPIGTRHLYYSFDDKQVSWSTILDPLVLLASKTFALCEEYIAGWFSFFPAAHLTPYVGILSVPPSSSVLIRPGKHIVGKYWDFDPSKRIRYRTDGEYEEHFRTVFAEAVRRRLRSDSAILAELSGGMDSSSIVCMADTLIARGATETPRLDTVSRYDDSEPNWNERPYFTKVEEKRGRTGYHIDLGLEDSFKFNFEIDGIGVVPGSGGRPPESDMQYAVWMKSQGNRVILSGTGGDEVMGGVPTPIPELANLLVMARFRDLARQLKLWALDRRVPWVRLLYLTFRGFIPAGLLEFPDYAQPVPWLCPEFVKRNRAALQGYMGRMRLFNALPSFQVDMATLDAMRRQMGCDALSLEPLHEKRYPYLDRGLQEFVYAVPREQLVRPGQRRSLMRRALVGIVPDEILNRRRKAFAGHSFAVAISRDWSNLARLTEEMASQFFGVIDSAKFSEILRKAQQGKEVHIVAIMRTLGIEVWLRNLQKQRFLTGGVRQKDDLPLQDAVGNVGPKEWTGATN